MTRSQALRFRRIIINCVVSGTLIAATPQGYTASYACKDAKTGQWTEAACTGAAKPPERPAEPEKVNEGWQPKIGMTMAEVEEVIHRAATVGHTSCCSSWLMSREIIKNRSTTSRGTREQWVFRQYGYAQSVYLYFDDGIVTSIEDSE